MICTITVVRYPKWLAWAGLLSMAVFRVPLWLSKPVSFWKLMGCGRNGTFDKTPDWRQWALLTVTEEISAAPAFLTAWWKWFGCEKWELIMKPIEGHGTWDGKACFGDLPRSSEYEGRIGILTRATIRINKLGRFWQHVDQVAQQMAGADGFLTSLGIGEIPWIKQATFSVWASKQQMKNFAYRMHQHAEVIQKTRKENWYSEDLFARFMILSTSGTLHGKDPLQGNM